MQMKIISILMGAKQYYLKDSNIVIGVCLDLGFSDFNVHVNQ